MKSWLSSMGKKSILLITGIATIGIMGAVYTTQTITPTSHNAHSLTKVASNTGYTGVKEITVYRTPTCGCCGGWIEHMKQEGFQVTDIKTTEIEKIKQQYNLPAGLESCHTSIADGYVIEGHIPALEVKRLLTEKPDVAGIAVPGMPLGTPGMEAGDIKEPFQVLAFNQKGEIQVFQEYQ